MDACTSPWRPADSIQLECVCVCVPQMVRSWGMSNPECMMFVGPPGSDFTFQAPVDPSNRWVGGSSGGGGVSCELFGCYSQLWAHFVAVGTTCACMPVQLSLICAMLLVARMAQQTGGVAMVCGLGNSLSLRCPV